MKDSVIIVRVWRIIMIIVLYNNICLDKCYDCNNLENNNRI